MGNITLLITGGAHLVGGGFSVFFGVHPETWGSMIQFDLRTFLQRGGSTISWWVKLWGLSGVEPISSFKSLGPN